MLVYRIGIKAAPVLFWLVRADSGENLQNSLPTAFWKEGGLLSLPEGAGGWTVVTALPTTSRVPASLCPHRESPSPLISEIRLEHSQSLSLVALGLIYEHLHI